ncbi:hypothetical protein VPH35_047732 [Triticum aestivum]
MTTLDAAVATGRAADATTREAARAGATASDIASLASHGMHRATPAAMRGAMAAAMVEAVVALPSQPSMLSPPWCFWDPALAVKTLPAAWSCSRCRPLLCLLLGVAAARHASFRHAWRGVVHRRPARRLPPLRCRQRQCYHHRLGPKEVMTAHPRSRRGGQAKCCSASVHQTLFRRRCSRPPSRLASRPPRRLHLFPTALCGARPRRCGCEGRLRRVVSLACSA